MTTSKDILSQQEDDLYCCLITFRREIRVMEWVGLHAEAAEWHPPLRGHPTAEGPTGPGQELAKPAALYCNNSFLVVYQTFPWKSNILANAC